ncbi:hypothetical protein SAMN05444920_1092 [Nonomuraea solani]|uniref:Uncharacterized protein n=1 Tax=Nonomuraea solani TaxID=1144553 RepID=A0A1H6ED88_9ACTN|nr:hypothetical protein SAMN05444920_1092 [Nonomuraea solani]
MKRILLRLLSLLQTSRDWTGAGLSERLGMSGRTVAAAAPGQHALHTGADTVETLGVHLGLLGSEFDVTGPPELLAHLRRLAGRYPSDRRLRPCDHGGCVRPPAERLP